MKIAAVDPGGGTGWSLFEEIPVYDAGSCTPKEIRLDLVDKGLLDAKQHHAHLEAQLALCGPLDLVICERFENRNNDFTELISLEYIGCVKAFCQRHHIELVLQGSSQAKGFATNDKLARLGFLQRPLQAKKDINDSIRHMVYFACCSMKAPIYMATSMIARLKADG